MKKKGKAPRTPKVAPKDHPPAWSSVLWPHLDTIRSMRRQRKTWLAITEHLKNDHGITITHRSVRNFFKRAVNVKLPLGFEPLPVERPAQAPPAPPDAPPLQAETEGLEPFLPEPKPHFPIFNPKPEP